MSRSFLAGILAAAFMARLCYGLAFPAPGEIGFRYDKAPETLSGGPKDPDGYVTLAVSYADTRGLSEDGKPSAHREPAYPVVLGLCFALFGKSYLTVLAVNCVFGALAVWALFEVGALLFSVEAGLVAAALAAVYPPFLYYAAQPLRESLMLLMATLGVWALLRAREDERVLGFAAAGAVNALAALTNTSFLPFGLLLAPMALPAVCRRRLAGALRLGGAYAVAFVLVYSVWPLRNHRAFGTWVLGSTAGAGSTFYTYLIVPQDAGGTQLQAEILAKDPVTREGSALGSIERERFFWKAGLERVRRDPAAYLKLVAWRFFWDQWRLWPRPRAYGHSYAAVKWVSIVTDGWIVPLGFLGMLLVRLRPPETVWVYLFFFSVHGLYSLVLTMLRYRLSLMPWLILFASCAILSAWERLRRARTP